MIRLPVAVLVVTVASPASVMSLASQRTPTETIIKVREACGAGMHRVGDVCARTHARRAVSRCAKGLTC